MCVFKNSNYVHAYAIMTEWLYLIKTPKIVFPWAISLNLSWPQLPLTAHRLWWSATSEHPAVLSSGTADKVRTLFSQMPCFTRTQQQIHICMTQCNICRAPNSWTRADVVFKVLLRSNFKGEEGKECFNHNVGSGLKPVTWSNAPSLKSWLLPACMFMFSGCCWQETCQCFQ